MQIHFNSLLAPPHAGGSEPPIRTIAPCVLLLRRLPSVLGELRIPFGNLKDRLVDDIDAEV